MVEAYKNNIEQLNEFLNYYCVKAKATDLQVYIAELQVKKDSYSRLQLNQIANEASLLPQINSSMFATIVKANKLRKSQVFNNIFANHCGTPAEDSDSSDDEEASPCIIKIYVVCYSFYFFYFDM